MHKSIFHYTYFKYMSYIRSGSLLFNPTPSKIAGFSWKPMHGKP